MIIAVTGATGFIGRHVVSALALRDNTTVVAMSRSLKKLEELATLADVVPLCANIYEERDDWFELLHYPDVVIHLAWNYLDNFKAEEHHSVELPAHKKFLSTLVSSGVPSLAVAGTCFEYGLQEGVLDESTPLEPVTPYGKAKAELFLWLAEYVKKNSCNFKWLRYFYMYGEGQHAKSLIPQLERSIKQGDLVFNMSSGEQTRDFLPITTLAEYTVLAATQMAVTGPVNICSGQPETVLSLVKRVIEEKKANIVLNRGFYPYPDYEPMHFWGNCSKLMSIL